MQPTDSNTSDRAKLPAPENIARFLSRRTLYAPTVTPASLKSVSVGEYCGVFYIVKKKKEADINQNSH